MTRDDALTFAKHLLFEDAASTGIGSTTNLNNTIDVANRAVWRKAVSLAPSVFTTTSADLSYIGATGYYDLTSALNPYIISRVDLKFGGSYVPLEPSAPQEQGRYNQTVAVTAGVTPVSYWLDGSKLKMLPGTATDQTFRIVYVPTLAALSAGSSVLLGGALVEFHDLVCYEAERILRAKDEAPDVFKDIRADLYRDFTRHLSRRSTYRPHNIVEVVQ